MTEQLGINCNGTDLATVLKSLVAYLLYANQFRLQ